ncbi:hypothetical protein GOODEAATRI_010594 [Goodea atripinnis]|uniref:Agouti signaling protein n=1 Tax=Goodea atripinnis TaxID=208336 RepID=A0ABV0N3F5_9TELE
MVFDLCFLCLCSFLPLHRVKNIKFFPSAFIFPLLLCSCCYPFQFALSELPLTLRRSMCKFSKASHSNPVLNGGRIKENPGKTKQKEKKITLLIRSLLLVA